MVDLMKTANTEDNNESLGSFELVPAGEYIAEIIDSEWVETKAGDGKYLLLQFRILDGEHAGRIIFEILNLDNPNPVAVEIADKTLNTICKKCNKFGVKRSDELHGIPLYINVIIKEATEKYDAQNKIKSYKSVSKDEKMIIDEVISDYNIPF